MKTGVIIAFIIGTVVIGLMGWVRLAPSKPGHWHHLSDQTGAGQVTRPGGHILRRAVNPDQAHDLLARLDRIALATPRTARLAGSVEEGRITYITRSRIFGFPDYTTVGLDDGMLEIHARLRFGHSDLGVNRARVQAWVSALDAGES